MISEPTGAPPNLQHLFPAVERQLREIPGFEEFSLQASRAAHSAVLRGGSPNRALADLLHGVWLGHPLHAVLVHIPIGAWLIAGLCDAAGAAGSHEADRAADALIALGALAALPTALAGAADYSAIPEDAAPIAAAHATLNNVALGLYLLSLGSRRSGSRVAGRLLSTIALGVVSVSASLGGDLVYRKRVGVDRSPDATRPDDWTAVLPAGELADGEARRVELGDEAALLYRSGDQIYAISAICSHAGGPLEEGSFSGHCVECPWHQSVFDLRDGSVVHGPAVHAQSRYEVRQRDGQIELRCWAPPAERRGEASAERARALGED